MILSNCEADFGRYCIVVRINEYYSTDLYTSGDSATPTA